MDGTGQWLEHILRQHTAQHGSPDTPYNLIEVGSAGCVTLRAFADILAECGKTKWRAVGFDLMPDKAWSLDWVEVERSFTMLPRLIHAVNKAPRGYETGMHLVLLDDPRAYLKAGFPLPIDFAFIDASHGISCGRDFEAVEKRIAPGGLVVFHDYGEPEQGTDWQTFDREFISVRSYVHRLGLAAPCNTPRKGWRFVGEIKGSRHWGQDGNSAAVVQRTTEPLQHQPELLIDP